MGYSLQRRGDDYLILEAGDEVGAFFKKFPRHRKLISINKVHTSFEDPEINLRWDWNSLLGDDNSILFKEFSSSYFPPADAMVAYLGAFARHYKLNVRTSSTVARIARDDNFLIHLVDGEVLTCRILVVATGRTQPYVPQIPGIELAENYTDMSVDPVEFTNQRVFIIGKGNSAFETADNLIETASVIHLASPNNIQLAWKTHYVGHLRAVNNNFLDTYQLKSQNTIIDGVIERITGNNGKFTVSVRYSHADGQRIDVPVDRVIACTGFKFDDALFDEGVRPKLVHDGRFPAVTSEWESINVKDMYFAGALMHGRDYKETFSGFIHGFRYNVEVLARFLDSKYKSEELGCWQYKNDPRELFDRIFQRIHTNSSLFQQPGYLCDLIVLSPETGDHRCLHYRDLPVDYVDEHDISDGAPYITLTMEYGKEDHPDPFNIRRHPDDGRVSAFIHPVFRHYKDGGMVSEYHIPEDLENNWYQELYMEPFFEYVCGVLDLSPPKPDWTSFSPPYSALDETTKCK